MTQERLTMRKIREILRLNATGLSNRAISRALQVSNSTVGEYLRRAELAGVRWPLDPNWGEDDLYQQLFPEREVYRLIQRPEPDWETVEKELKRKGVTLKLLWIEYLEGQPDGYKYTQFCTKYRQWARNQKVRGRFLHQGGEVMEVDYAGVKLTITDPATGATQQVSVFVAALVASCYTYAEVQSDEQQANWLGGHVKAFEFFGGVPKIVRPDNLKTGVKRANQYEPDLNPAYQEMAEHYGVAVLPARVRRPRDKANVENSVQNVERWVLAPLRNTTFFSLAEANQAVQKRLTQLNQRPMVHREQSRQALFETLERAELRPLPTQRYEYAVWKTATVNLDYHISCEKHYYSVPHHLVRQKVMVRVSQTLVQIFHKHVQVAVHPRKHKPGFSTQPEHMPSNHRFVLELDAQWLLKRGQAVGPHTTEYLKALLQARRFPEQAYRSCLGVLSLARKFPPDKVENACQQLLKAHLCSYQDLKAELARLPTVDPAPQSHENIRGENYYQ